MRFRKLHIVCIIILFLHSCTNTRNASNTSREYYSSHGFALIYKEELYKEKIISKKLNPNKQMTIHNSLKINTPIKILNPVNMKFIDTKVNKKAGFPKIFNIVITKNIADFLELDLNNPYVEILEVKKNKTFLAKESNIFDEEKNVAEKAPVDQVQMDDLNQNNDIAKEIKKKKSFYNLIISDFYYEDSAINLKNDLIEKTKMNNFLIVKINIKKYRLLSGPFEDFNALKSAYISLNNLGFENLMVNKK
jgi:hypothetical protein